MQLRSLLSHLLFVALLLPGTALAEPDPIAEAFFAPELVMQHQRAIALSDTQKQELRREIGAAQAQFTELQWKLQDEAERMLSLVNTPTVDEAQVQQQLDAVLDAERAVKHTQIGLMVRIKNLLNVDQQQRLRQLRAQSGDFDLGMLW